MERKRGFYKEVGRTVMEAAQCEVCSVGGQAETRTSGPSPGPMSGDEKGPWVQVKSRRTVGNSLLLLDTAVSLLIRTWTDPDKASRKEDRSSLFHSDSNSEYFPGPAP